MSQLASPRATYRLQLRPEFGFKDAAAVIDYLAALGISHVYLSPHLQAASGSSHGYDVVDPTRLNDELGDNEDHEALHEEIRRHGLGAVADIVPNHMSITEKRNAWWWDILENGPSSRFASFFDVDWDPPENKLRNTVLLPVLGDHYGRVLEAGEFKLAREAGSFLIRYHDHEFPVSPRTLDEILEKAARLCGSPDLERIAAAMGRLPPADVTDRSSIRERHRDKEILRGRLASLIEADSQTAKAIDEVVASYNQDPDLLDGLLERQNYRLAFWRTGGRELDYRRFFDIDTLIGVQVEDQEVFEATHSLILSWVESGHVSGLRVDHPDGLRDPLRYFERLRDRAPQAWIVAEKILEEGERLRPDWPVQGTTGYDFLNLVGRLFVDPDGEKPLSDFYERFTGHKHSYDDVVYEMKHLVMREVLAADINRLTALLMRVCEKHRRYRDYTRHEIHEALREMIACLRVYRTYIQPAELRIDDEDRRQINLAIDQARRFREDIDPDLFGFVENILTLQIPGHEEAEFIFQLQQLTGSVMAKGAEDTALYLYNRLTSLNEVGGAPGTFGMQDHHFHESMIERAEQQPSSMLATSTHDTKRSEDVRARINLLSQIPEKWIDTVERWSKTNDKHWLGQSPDRNAEYLLYQTLVGAHPLDEDRAIAYAIKAAREAKIYTSWISPNETYESALESFIKGILSDSGFRSELEAFVDPLIEPARIISLAQTLVKLTAVGVPDFYQGCELWDFSLVDPDNRRPVDYAFRRELLSEVIDQPFSKAWENQESGAPKLWLIHHLLTMRKDRPEVFADDRYEPLEVGGPDAGGIVAYLRSGSVAVVIPRFPLRLSRTWRETEVSLPAGTWQDIFTSERYSGSGVIAPQFLLPAPLSVLVRSDG